MKTRSRVMSSLSVSVWLGTITRMIILCLLQSSVTFVVSHIYFGLFSNSLSIGEAHFPQRPDSQCFSMWITWYLPQLLNPTGVQKKPQTIRKWRLRLCSSKTSEEQAADGQGRSRSASSAPASPDGLPPLAQCHPLSPTAVRTTLHAVT